MGSEDRILFYKGIIEYKTVNSLIKQLQEEFSRRSLPIQLYKKALVAMIEMLENIYKYCDAGCIEKIDPKYFPEIEIRKEGDKFILMAANPIFVEHGEALHERLKELTKFNHAEVLEVYKKTLMNGMFSDKGGAGLGLLEIARIASGQIIYSFKPIDADHEYYTIQVTVN